MTLKEAFAVIANKAPSSAPGTDGLPYQVYTTVPGMMALLMRVCQWVLPSGDVPYSWNIAYIRCLLKNGKDKLIPESYRPISLICMDCKIFTGVIAARLQRFSREIFGLSLTTLPGTKRCFQLCCTTRKHMIVWTTDRSRSVCSKQV